MPIKIKQEELEAIQTKYHFSRLQDHQEALEKRKQLHRVIEAALGMIMLLVICTVLFYAFFK